MNKNDIKKSNEEDHSNEREKLKSRYKCKWKECKEVFYPTNGIKEYLGETDADIEWSHDARGAYERFLCIDAYERFKENDIIVLIGRTGTGKSSILNRYMYAVRHNEITEFKMVISIKFQRFFDKIKSFEFIDDTNDGHYIKDVIDILIQLHVMQKISKEILEDGDNKRLIKEILDRKLIKKDTNLIERICDDIDEKFMPSDKLRDVMLSLKNSYKEVMDESTVDCIRAFLNMKKVVVLADSLDYYDITEKKVIVINRALFDLAFDYLKDLPSKRYLLKVAIPSEVYKHILEIIVAKRKVKTVTIEWRYKDIIKMLAIKVFYFFKIRKYEFAKEFVEGFCVDDFYDFNIAKDFLHTMLPETCHASIPICFDTMSYCIRHTQKKPRQILKIFNSFIEKICEEKQFKYFIYNDESIPQYIHRAQYDIIDDALSMYNAYVKQSILPIVSGVLRNKRNFMDVRQLNNAINEVNSMCSRIGLSTDDVKQILIESGLIGEVYSEHYIKENSELFQNHDVNKISVAIFEYQRKDTLTHKSGAMYVLHPMCYEFYVNKIDYNALVYPAPADDMGDSILDKLERDNIIY